MKIGILGDIHGNLEALTAVLEEMDRVGVKKFISVGDVVGYGADPIECLRTLRKLDTVIVAGNHDQAVCGQLSLDYFNSYARQSALWTRKQLDENWLAFLRGLPLLQIVENFTVVHATLYNPEKFEYIQTTYDASLSFERQKTNLAFIGHSHVPMVFYKKGRIEFGPHAEIRINEAEKTLVNVGAIGQPRDENPDAVCAYYDTDEGLVRLSRVSYDIERAASKILKAGLPEILAERLRYGR